MSTRILAAGVLSAFLVFMGAGCIMRGEAPQVGSPSGLSPATLTEQLVFRAGDRLEIEQTFFGLGGLPSLLWKAKSLRRGVTVDAFEPKVQASISWLAETDQETEDSARARANYEARIAERKKGDDYPPPPAVHTEIVTARGSVNKIDLLNSQTLSLPAYWTPGIIDLQGQRSGVWLSQNAYLELTRSSSTNVYFDVSSDAAAQLLQSSKDWVDAVSRLRTQAARVETRQDPARLHLDGPMSEWPLIVNGHQETVNVWKATSAFGQLVILANEQNPLILKTTVNPVFPGIGNAAQKSTDWNTLFGYEIKEIMTRARS